MPRRSLLIIIPFAVLALFREELLGGGYGDEGDVVDGTIRSSSRTKRQQDTTKEDLPENLNNGIKNMRIKNEIEMPALYPKACSDATGPFDLRPAPPLSNNGGIGRVEGLEAEVMNVGVSTPVIHVYVKASSSTEVYRRRSEWIARTWGREVATGRHPPHTLTFVMDGGNTTFEAALDRQGRLGGGGVRDRAVGGGGGGGRGRGIIFNSGLDRENDRGGEGAGVNGYGYRYRWRVASLPETRGAGEYKDRFRRREAEAEEDVERKAIAEARRAAMREGLSRLAARHATVAERHAFIDRLNAERPPPPPGLQEHIQAIHASYAAQRLKTRWVLNQKNISGHREQQQKKNSNSEEQNNSWVCYFDDDLVVNMTNLVRDLAARQPLCTPSCWIAMVTWEMRPQKRQRQQQRPRPRPPPRGQQQRRRQQQAKQPKREEQVVEQQDQGQGPRRSEIKMWPVGGWCMEALLVARLQRDFLPKSDEEVGWNRTDDLGLAEALMNFTSSSSSPDHHNNMRMIAPFHSDRWLIDHRPKATPPRWFNASRRRLYAVYHQVDYYDNYNSVDYNDDSARKGDNAYRGGHDAHADDEYDAPSVVAHAAVPPPYYGNTTDDYRHLLKCPRSWTIFSSVQ